MAKFNVTLDRKHTIWHRSTAVIEAETLEEAQLLLKEQDEGSDNGVDIHGSWLHDSCETLSECENYALSILDDLVIGSHSELPSVVDVEIPSGSEVIDFVKEENWEIK